MSHQASPESASLKIELLFYGYSFLITKLAKNLWMSFGKIQELLLEIDKSKHLKHFVSVLTPVYNKRPYIKT